MRSAVRFFALSAAALAALAMLAASPAAAVDDVRVIPLTTTAGTQVSIVTTPALTPPPGSEDASGTREYFEIWHRYHTDAIYTTTGAAGYPGSHFSGTYLNPPRQAELAPWYGDGTPTWAYGGTEFYTDAAKIGDTLAALNCTPQDSTVRVLEWNPESSTPLYSYVLHPCRPLTAEGWSAGKGIQVSNDGSTVAAVVNMYTPGGLRARLCIFRNGSGTPTTDVVLPDGTASALAITWDGAYVAVYAWPMIYVYSRDANAIRWSGPAGSGNDALAISDDGTYLAWGWSTLNVRRWDGSAYQGLWTKTYTPSYYVTECAMSSDRLAVGLYKANTYDDNVIEMYHLPSSVPDWTYHYPVSAAAGAEMVLPETVDVISEMAFDPSGSILAAASWGPRFPEIQAVSVVGGAFVAGADTPGSMFDVDITSLIGGDAYMAACGKHVHAGTAGRGGDLYSFWVALGTAVDDPGAAGGSSLRAVPNPARGETSIRLDVSQAGPVRITIHDLLGREVAHIAESLHPACLFVRVWDGRDDAGRALPSGVYLARAQGGEPVRIVLAR